MNYVILVGLPYKNTERDIIGKLIIDATRRRLKLCHLKAK